MERIFNYKRQIADPRDVRVRFMSYVNIPKTIDLRPKMQVVRDQQNIGCCAGFAAAALHGKLFTYRFSPLFAYYIAREEQGTINEDSGTSIRAILKTAAKVGVSLESVWKYDPQKIYKKPTKTAYLSANRYKISQYWAVGQTEVELKSALAAGIPVLFGFECFASFLSEEVANTGIIPMPKKEEGYAGAHAAVLVGYTEEHFIVRNSWGTVWGDNGHFYMPINYVCNAGLAFDFWTAKK